MELLRKATPARRAKLARSLTRTTMKLSRHGLRQRRPDASEQELAVAFVALCYGDALADGLRAYIARRA